MSAVTVFSAAVNHYRIHVNHFADHFSGQHKQGGLRVRLLVGGLRVRWLVGGLRVR